MGRVRMGSPTTWVAAVAGAALTGALVLAMSPANAEAASTTTTLTLTGMVSSTCDLGTGGTVAYVAPGGTMTIKASLAGANVRLPITGQTIALDSSVVASFVDEVTIGATKYTLRSPSDTIVLRNVTGTRMISWQASSIKLVPALLGGLTVPLSASNVVGGELDWSGKIVASKSTDCGIAVSVPTTKLHVGTHTVTVPGINASLPNPIPKLLPTPRTAASSGAAASQHPSAGGVNYTPPGLSVPQQVMPHAINYGGVGGAGGTGHATPAGGRAAAAAGSSAAAHRSPSPTTSPAAKVKPGAGAELGLPDGRGGPSRPVLLALAAILALFTVSAMWARTHLLRHPR